ncbi:hypothetical protein M9H77_18094 [Catharanthus roseus]|uniref:Uncharacterized protein n=1 Tax=Catharanthus roseus TaxID=4058 RepID=A0ACC0B6G9_CATRO|nr:hypothetical protein M9H77_18094 [Catharanthus roseus]
MVHGSKKRVHLAAASTSVETSTTPVETAYTPASILHGMDVYSSSSGLYTLATLALFLQLPYSSSVPTSTPSTSSRAGMSSTPALSLSAYPPAPAPSSAHSPAPPSEGVVDSCILILPTAVRDFQFYRENSINFLKT